MSGVYKQSFKQNYVDNVELSIYNCGLQRCTPGHSWGPGVRDHYLIHLVVSGHGIYKAGGKTYLLGPGDLFLARPNQLILYTAGALDPWEYCWVGFNGACAAHLIQQTPFTPVCPVYHCPDVENIRTALHNIFLARGPHPQDEAAMVGHLYLFLSQLIRKQQEAEPRPMDTGSQYVASAIKYIQFNYSHDTGIDDIARAVGVSRSHLYRVFMSTIGQSPIDFLTDYRIREACNLLVGSQLSIAEIAVSVGFFDQFYFSRVFKKAKGVPPSKYLASLEKAEQEQETT